MIKYNSEILRKIFHLSSLWIPMLYLCVTAQTMITILFPLTAIALMTEGIRRISPELNNLIYNTIGNIMRQEEKLSFSGATYLLIAATLTVLIFNREVAILALSVLMISDSAAALIGRRFGKTHIFDKSLEGALGFFISGVGVYYFLVTFCDIILPLNISLLAIFSTTLAELFAKKIRLDDNLVIPLSLGLTFKLVSFGF